MTPENKTAASRSTIIVLHKTPCIFNDSPNILWTIFETKTFMMKNENYYFLILHPIVDLH